jgi:ribosomal protein S18
VETAAGHVDRVLDRQPFLVPAGGLDPLGHPPVQRDPHPEILTQEQVTYVDYKDVNLLRRFQSDRAKIRARRVTGNSTQQQKAVANAVKNAREMALLPYTNRVTQQRGGRRSDSLRDDESTEDTGIDEAVENEDFTEAYGGDAYEGGGYDEAGAPAAGDTEPNEEGNA